MKTSNATVGRNDLSVGQDLRDVRDALVETREKLPAELAPFAGEFLAQLDFEPVSPSLVEPAPVRLGELRKGVRSMIRTVEQALEQRPDDAPVLGPMADVLRQQSNLLDEVAARIGLGRSA